MKLLKRPNRTYFAKFGSDTLPDMPNEWWDKIRTKRGTDVKLVIMKQMFATDLNPHRDRFSIPFKQIRDSSFLIEDEKSKLKEQKENIPVTLMEPYGDESKMLLRQWNLKSSSTYVLTSSWNKVLERNHQGPSGKFKQKDIVQLWSFRRNGELWLALFKVGDSGSKGENGDGASASHKDEKRKLKEPKEKIPVTLMEPCGSESEMWLRQWNLKSSSTYVLTSSWKKVLERNHQGSSGKFKQNDIVQLWSFRHDGDVWLALFKVEEQ
ncbi:hypothetical protein GH714_034854 [Hevea brasiliensis]|uniref:TF-B3 domain-containing protein n=1 Tax=Hevea brasiliensis TaxID=3981 RepID=A0A6A6N4T1_HEVBR|nr:hypothetical protein GH714_034854 [Hevea brasiliensis]